jgi:hypothetical protein
MQWTKYSKDWSLEMYALDAFSIFDCELSFLLSYLLTSLLTYLLSFMFGFCSVSELLYFFQFVVVYFAMLQ